MAETGSNKTIEKLFEIAISIEYEAANLYEKFSKLFSHVPDIAEFWDGMQEYEIQHASILQNIRNALSLGELLTHATHEMWQDIHKTQHFFSTQLVRPINTLEDAYQLAHAIEFSELNGIFQFLASDLMPYDKQKEFIIANILKHQQKIIDFSRNYGDGEWRKEIEIQP